MDETSTGKTGQHSQFSLFRERRFWPLFVTQFLGAFNDNAYKNALVVLLTFGAASWTSMKPEVLANVAAGLFILPFFLFSATAGQLADKFDKARLARATKLLEIVIVMLAALGFWRQSLPVLLAALFLLGLQSALFGPVKYAILPQHLRPDELIGGNALVEAGTFVSVLLGTLTGGLLAGLDGGVGWIVAICLAVAVGGYLASRAIPEAPAPAPELAIAANPLRETWRCIGFARQERSVFLSILAISWFWAYGALLLAQFPAYTKGVLGGDESLVTTLLAVFSIGIGAGSLLCERLTRRRGKLVEPGLVPLGALGMVIFGADLAFAAPGGAAGAALPLAEALGRGGAWRVLADLLLLGASGGLYCVPLYALVQQRSAVEYRARIIAANNILNSLFMVLAAVGASLFLDKGHGIPSLFLLAAGLHAMVTIYIFSVVPEFLIRALAWLGWRRES
ncbi:MAG: MFS transporter [Candidatus Accumulibacter sp.]|jgi:MFS family permease|nr:MFS transporter [Accumulibacter sp.]